MPYAAQLNLASRDHPADTDRPSITGQNYLFGARQQPQSKVPEAIPNGGSVRVFPNLFCRSA
jgi:hypothetical protein